MAGRARNSFGDAEPSVLVWRKRKMRVPTFWIHRTCQKLVREMRHGGAECSQAPQALRAEEDQHQNKGRGGAPAKDKAVPQ